VRVCVCVRTEKKSSVCVMCELDRSLLSATHALVVHHTKRTWDALYTRVAPTVAFLPLCAEGYLIEKVPGCSYSLESICITQTHNDISSPHDLAQSLSSALLRHLETMQHDRKQLACIIAPIPDIQESYNTWEVRLTCLVFIEHTLNEYTPLPYPQTLLPHVLTMYKTLQTHWDGKKGVFSTPLLHSPPIFGYISFALHPSPAHPTLASFFLLFVCDTFYILLVI
jgi:hypothetical protein